MKGVSPVRRNYYFRPTYSQHTLNGAKLLNCSIFAQLRSGHFYHQELFTLSGRLEQIFFVLLKYLRFVPIINCEPVLLYKMWLIRNNWLQRHIAQHISEWSPQSLFVSSIENVRHLMRNNNDTHSNIHMKHFHFHFMHNENQNFKLLKWS